MAGSKVGSAWYELRADDAKLKGDLNRATGTITTSGSTAGKGFSSGFSKGLAGVKSAIGGMLPLVGALGAAFAATKIVAFFGDAVRAAQEEEASIATLTQSIKQNDEAWDGNMQAIEAVIEERQKLAFSDDEQRDSLRSLVAITGDVNKALEIQRTAMDFARLRGIDLATATTILGKVYGGNIGILSRYGIQMEAGATSTEALARIQQMAAGQAEAYGETSKGAAEAAAIAFDNLTEEIGKLLLPIMSTLARFAVDILIPALGMVVDVLSTLGGAVGYVFGAIGDQIQQVTAIVGNFAMDFGDQGAEIHRLADETGVDFQTMKDRIQLYMAESGASFEEATAKMEADALNARVVIGDAMTDGIIAARDAIHAGGPVIAIEAGKVAGMLPSQIRARDAEIRAAAYNGIVQFAAGILDAQNKPKLAMDALIEAQKTALSRSAEITYLQGLLASQELADGLVDRRPAVSAAAQGLVIETNARLVQLNASGYQAGYAGGTAVGLGLRAATPAVGATAAQLRGVGAQNMDLGTVPSTHGANAGARYAAGIGSQYSNVNARAAGVASGARAPLVALSGQTYAWGQQLGYNFANGLGSTYSYAYSKAVAIAGGVGAALRIRSPAQSGPLSEDAGIWGKRLGYNFAGGMVRSVSAVHRAAVAMGGAAVPHVGPMPITNFGAAGGFGSSGATTNLGGIVIHINGFSGSQGDIENVSRRLADSIRLRARTAF